MELLSFLRTQVHADEADLARRTSFFPSLAVEMDRGEGRIQRDRRGHVIGHLLNHQVHHRGQAHAILASTDVAAPKLDEFPMPSEAHLRTADLRALGRSEATLFG